MTSFHRGDVIRKLRRQRGWSLVDLAAESGVDKGTISKIERGGNCRPATLERLASALHVPLTDLANYSGDGLPSAIKAVSQEDPHRAEAIQKIAQAISDLVEAAIARRTAEGTNRKRGPRRRNRNRRHAR